MFKFKISESYLPKVFLFLIFALSTGSLVSSGLSINSQKTKGDVLGHTTGGNHWTMERDVADSEKLKMYFQTTASPATPAMTLTTNNNIGIGTTSPLAPFDIRRNHIRFGMGNTISAGLPSPSTDSTDELVYYAANNGGPTDHRFHFEDDPADSMSFWGDSCGGACHDLTRSSLIMKLVANGNVGLGVVNPNHRLHLAPGSIYYIDSTNSKPWWIRQNSSDDQLAFGSSSSTSDSSIRCRIYNNGNFSCSGSKNFEIDHPTKSDKKLVHAAIEGPESAVFYRGEAQLSNGQVVVTLPEYFETLTLDKNRTIQLTNIDGFDKLAIKTQNGAQIKEGKFIVYSDNKTSNQKLNWEVKAVRADISELEVVKDK